jgi:hypothetical protein
MRALRQMLDIARSLCKSEITMNEGTSFLAQLLEKAALVYGNQVSLPKQIYWNLFAAIKVDDAGENINALRAMLEKNIQTQE